MDVLATLIMAIFVFAALITEIQSRKAGIVPAPTWRNTRNRMIALLSDNPEGDILELGSGWGGSLIALSRHYPEHRIIGYEIATLPFIVSSLRARLSGCKNIILKQSDFMSESFSNAGAVFCYLSFRHMELLEPKFRKELKPGTEIVSRSFPLPNIAPDKKETFREGLWQATVYLYRCR